MRDTIPLVVVTATATATVIKYSFYSDVQLPSGLATGYLKFSAPLISVKEINTSKAS